MVNEKQMSVIQRALGIIEGVMLLADLKVAETLGTAVEMMDDALKEVLKDGK